METRKRGSSLLTTFLGDWSSLLSNKEERQFFTILLEERQFFTDQSRRRLAPDRSWSAKSFIVAPGRRHFLTEFFTEFGCVFLTLLWDKSTTFSFWPSWERSRPRFLFGPSVREVDHVFFLTLLWDKSTTFSSWPSWERSRPRFLFGSSEWERRWTCFLEENSPAQDGIQKYRKEYVETIWSFWNLLCDDWESFSFS